MHKESDFYKLVDEHLDRPLRLFVYNADFDVTREVVIVPNRAWSASGAGEGLLGCGVGYGVLHRIPIPQARPPINGSTSLHADSHDSSHDIASSSSSSSSASGRPSPSYQHQLQVQPQALPPKRMTASLTATLSTPPRSSSPNSFAGSKTGLGQTLGPGAQGWKTTIPAPSSSSSSSSIALGNRAALGSGTGNSSRESAFALSAPPRSPSSASLRNSVAEMIAEED